MTKVGIELLGQLKSANNVNLHPLPHYVYFRKYFEFDLAQFTILCVSPDMAGPGFQVEMIHLVFVTKMSEEK